MRRLQIRGVYAITPESADTGQLLRMVERSLHGGVRLVQYRNKTSPASLRNEQAGLLASMCRRYAAVFIVNDDVDLAVRVNADGIHIGRDDASVEHARERIGVEKIIGVSCYDELALARRAIAAGADYVAFGSVFPSHVKPHAVRAPLHLFREARSAFSNPIVGVGGISAANGSMVIAAGADAVAVVSGLFGEPSIEVAARELCALFDTAEIRP